MFNNLVTESKEFIDKLSSKLNQQEIDKNVHRSQSVINGVVVFQLEQQLMFELNDNFEPEQVLSLCNLALNFFFVRLNKDLANINDSKSVVDILEENREKIQTALINHTSDIEEMRPGVDHGLVLITYYTTQRVINYTLFLAEYIEEEFKKLVFMKEFTIV